jgi:hypothetical protein
VFLNKNTRIITLFVIFLFISIAWNPIIIILGEVEFSKKRTETEKNKLDYRALSDTYFESSPAVLQYSAPLNNQKTWGLDNSYESITKIVVGINKPTISGNKSYIYCFESNESAAQKNIVSWKYLISDQFGIYSSPAIANIDPTTDTPEIVFGADTGYIYCLNTEGNLLWKKEISSGKPIRSSPAIADIYDDPNIKTDNEYLEIIVGSEDNKLYCISYDYRTSQWNKKYKFTTEGKITSSPTVADINDDSNLDIIVGSDDGRIYCLDHEFKLQWDVYTGAPVRSTAGVADINRDGNFEIIIGSDNGIIYCLGKDGHQLDNFDLGFPIRSSPAIANLDPSDEELEFIIGYGSGVSFSSTNVVCLKLEYNNGQWIIDNKWKFSYDYIKKFSLYINAIAVDKNQYPDGGYETIVSDGHNIFILDSLGSKIAQYSNHLYGGSPIVADLDNDGNLEITVGQTVTDFNDNTEQLHIKQTNYKCPPDIIKWGMFGAGEKHNGNGDNRFAILIEGSKGDNDFEQDQFRSNIQEMARILTQHPRNNGPGYTGYYLRDHVFYVGVHDDIPELDMFKRIPENNDLNNPDNNIPDDGIGKKRILKAIKKVSNLCDSYDSVIFYYTSHGRYNGSDFESRKYLFDANDCHVPYSQSGDLGPIELNDALDSIICLKLFIILQPCYSGNWIEYLNNKGNRIIIASDMPTNPGAQVKLAIFDKCNIIITDSEVHDLYWVGKTENDGKTIYGIDDSYPKIDSEEYDNEDTDQHEFGKTCHQWYCWVKNSSSNNELYEIDKSRSDNLDANDFPQFNVMFFENYQDQGAEFVSGLTEAFYKDYLTGNSPNRNNELDADEYTKNRYLKTDGNSNGFVSCKEAYEFMIIWHFGIQIKKLWDDDPVIDYTKLPEGENYLLF